MSKFLEVLKQRVRNYGFWTSLIALLPIMCQAVGYTKLPADYATVINALLAFLVAAGIVNNPTTDTKGFLDDKQERIQG